MKCLKLLILISLTILISQIGYSIYTCTLDLPIVGISNYEWVESEYPVSNDEEIAYAACRKAAELSGDKLCNAYTCVKNMIDWSPGTGAYGFNIHPTSIGHSHSYGVCDGGTDNFIFGYNSDLHKRGSHCSYPTAPGKIDWYYSGSYRYCHEDGAGSFSCGAADPFCGDNVCDANEDCSTCDTDCGCGSQVCCNSECQEPLCSSDSDCGDGNELTIDTCNNPDTCNANCNSVACFVNCHANSDCNDNNALTDDICNNPNTCNSNCVNTPCSIECNINSDCNDNNLGTIDTCILGGTCDASCTQENCAVCSFDSECNDNSPLTIDKCKNPSTCNASCSNEPCDISCSYNSDCNDNNDLTNDVCTSPSTCLSKCSNVQCNMVCQSDLDCSDQNTDTIDSCNNPGKCEASCSNSPKPSLVNNNVCDISSGENCVTAPFDCKCNSDEICDTSRTGESGCYKIRCGDGYKDIGEDSGNCCLDFKCFGGKKCKKSTMNCVECITNSDCNWGVCDIGSNTCVECSQNKDCDSNQCDTTSNKCVECIEDSQCNSRTIWESNFVCSSDFRKVMQKGKFVDGVCNRESHTCIGKESDTAKVSKDCSVDNTYCQEGHCGCSEGFSVCKELKNCVKMDSLKSNAPCKCDFQCKSSYCGDDNTCIDVLNIQLSSESVFLKPDEETIVTLSVDNTLDKEVNVNMALNIGAGAEIIEFISCQHGSGNQCKISKELGGRSREDVTLRIRGISETVVPLMAKITYEIDDKVIEVTKESEIDFSENIPTNISEMQSNSLFFDKILRIVSLIFIIIIISLFFNYKKNVLKYTSKLVKKAHTITEAIVNIKSLRPTKKDIIDSLHKLVQMRKDGHLTKKEFDKSKKKLLKDD